MLRERHSGSRRGRSRGTPPGPTERGHTGRAAVDAPSLSSEVGREISGENLFFYHSFLLFFVLHLLVSKVSSILVRTRKRGWRSFRSVSEKMPQISGVL